MKSKFLGVNDFYGSLARGKSSDLIVLDSNPLINIQAIDQIRMVMGELIPEQSWITY